MLRFSASLFSSSIATCLAVLLCTACESATPEDDVTELAFVTPPASMVTVGDALTVMFTVDTGDEIHVTEIRACSGHDVANCGAGDQSSFELSAPAMENQDHYMGTITLDEGEWTVVGFAHIGANPHTTSPANVTAAP